MDIKIKRAAANSPFNQNLITAGNLTGFDIRNYSQKSFSGQRCSVCKTDDLKFAVENNGKVYCRRCEQQIEFVRREYPGVIAKAREVIHA